MNEKTVGAWVVHHANKLQHVTDTGEFERIQSAGKCGLLLSGLAADDEATLTGAHVQAIARAAGINTVLELPALIDQLRARRLVDVSSGGDVAVLGVASSAVLAHTAGIYESLAPTPGERAAIELAETASTEPLPANRAAQFLEDSFALSSEEVTDLLKASEEIGFTDAEELAKGEKLYFNGNLFRRDAARKMQAIMASLTAEDERHLREIETQLKACGCMELSSVKTVLGDALLEKMQAIGMYDVSLVENNTEKVAYVTRPSAFAKYGDALVEDAMDLAKAFVASLTYGMSRSSYTRGQITMIEKLLRKLINGGRVGAVKAIGEDYRVLEMKRVVQLEDAGNGKYFMRLLKREVGELALQVIMQGDASEKSLPGFFTAPMSKYVGPELNRERVRKKQVEPARKAVANIIRTMRTGTGGGL